MAEAIYKRISIHTLEQGQEESSWARGVDRHLILVALVVAMVLVSSSLFYVWAHHQVISLGYEISQAGIEEQNLLQENKKLRLELAELKSPSRIEEMALNELGFMNPQKEQRIIVR